MTTVSTRLLTPSSAATYLGITRRQLHSLRCTGVIAAACVQPTFYELRELDRFAHAQGWHRTYELTDETVTLIYDRRPHDD